MAKRLPDTARPESATDRAIFTAGSCDLPRAFHEQLKQDALLLAVVKNAGFSESSNGLSVPLRHPSWL
ncbi:MAG TPA: hypothetical protein VHJ58_19395 [Vicinamibacterales bacterium]|jgi:hypothetical protein|nr:hypothetical protein [Vicinamibacterales bacterium]